MNADGRKGGSAPPHTPSSTHPTPPRVGSDGRLQVPLRLQCAAWGSLGKLCLSDFNLARECVPLMAATLQSHRSPAVRNNVLLVLADMCTQHTGLVEPYVARLAGCLLDPVP